MGSLVQREKRTRAGKAARLVPFDPVRVWWQFVVADSDAFPQTFLFDPGSVPRPELLLETFATVCPTVLLARLVEGTEGEADARLVGDWCIDPQPSDDAPLTVTRSTVFGYCPCEQEEKENKEQ
jgi:hypothetical protein